MIIDSIKDEFRQIVGDEWFLDTPEDLVVYSYDGFLPEFKPSGVIVPGDRDEISKIMGVANREKINIIPRGAGTNICGSSVAREGGIIIAFHRLNKILEIDRESMCAVVQPGVVNADLQKAVAGYGLMYPPDPASMFVSTIGGNVALNAGGPRGVKYGVTRDYLLGLEVVLPSGEVINTGGKALKNASGYDLTRLMCGSEGTLGILTEIIIRLVPLAPARATLQAIYSDLDDAATTVSAIIGSGIVPATLELIDRTVLDVISDYGGARFSKEAEALLLIEVDGEESLVEAQGKRIEEFCKERGAVQVERASTPEEAEKLWQARRTAFGAVASLRPNCIVEDATVPVKMLPAMIRKIVEITKKYDLKIGVLAHAGDGNLHPLIMTDLRDREEMARIDKAMEELYETAIGMGGTLSGEHGIGIAKDRFMGMEFNEASIELMRGIKRVFDPNNILNPGSFL
ncbi:MAG: FAD-binding protein [Desulfobacteraceae bacterium]|uniref:FAD-binding protein n=1 Tax=Candidatus Desulfacyla euxinica TaxID=2841693 RepID=A0A8J6T7C6_9DELT|nr:FAD-binding protein [Candidatus Desulfacyla euxinica]MBL6978029.1 FAD-binding protein [Desulfobacteraceae bacterium]MBL7217153.1 FAD-binding protein [Desulfobacteraceae bacterium]